jgi:RNA polymerase sigma-70 factor (ECF subfamily)
MSKMLLGTEDTRHGNAARQDVTRLLGRWHQGDDRALEQLLPIVYGELRRMAGRYLRREAGGRTLETQDLIHEAFLRLVDQRQVDWHNRAHFFAVAAQSMRRILTDRARRRASCKHGGGLRLVVLPVVPELPADGDEQILAVDRALIDLREVDQDLARIVELRFFGGLQQDEIAAVLGVSVPTVGRRFRLAKAWLYRRLSGRGPRHDA